MTDAVPPVTAQPATRGPVQRAERSLAPDLARGTALLGIALANSVVHVHDRVLGPGFRPVDGSAADRTVDVLVGVLVDNRAFPMFTLLYAYGLVMLLRRQAEHGAPWPAARTLLLRRCAWLGVFGLAHLVLLFAGDILTAYGLLGLALVPLLRLPDRTLAWIATGALVVFVGSSSLDGLPGPDTALPLPLPVDLDTASGALAGRTFVAAVQLLASPLVVLSFLTPAVVGVLLARRRVLEQPAEHRRLLRRLAVGGFCVSVPGAVPMALASAQVWQPSTVTGLLAGALHALTGLAGAVAFVAVVALLAAAREQRADARARDRARHGPLSAVVAVGQRSLTCYLLQSVLFVPLMAPWAAGLGVGAGTAIAAAVGTAVYLVTVAVAVALDRAGRQGPAEAVLRRLTYASGSVRTAQVPPEEKPGPGAADTTPHDVRRTARMVAGDAAPGRGRKTRDGGSCDRRGTFRLHRHRYGQWRRR